MKKMSERKRQKGDEARRIIAKLQEPGVMLSVKETEFVESLDKKLKRSDWVSRPQMRWLRWLELRHWGAAELERAVGGE